MMAGISRAHFPVTTLGPGRRIGIWFQGCSLRCAGCVSRDTWEFDAASEMPVAELLGWCRTVTSEGFDGVTISGGEPFDQPEALAALLDGLAAWRTGRAVEFDILCYSGHPFSRLRQRHGAILARLDALIPEPYQRRQHPGLKWRGSKNQLIVTLSERGARIYAPFASSPADSAMQLVVENGRVWMAGVPSAASMDAFHKACAERGIKLGGVSWLP
jgi:anaerobic ribonucleoside-triphosphate reductase activating protein